MTAIAFVATVGFLAMAMVFGRRARRAGRGPSADRGGVVVQGDNRGVVNTGKVKGNITVGERGDRPEAPAASPIDTWLSRGSLVVGILAGCATLYQCAGP